MARNNRLSFTMLLIMIVIVYSIMPIVNVFFSRYLTTYSYMLVCVLTLAIIIFSNGSQSLNSYVSILLPFIFYELLTFFNRSDSIVMWGYQVMLFLLPVALGYYLFYEQDDTSRKLSFVTFRFAIIVTIITTIVGCIRNPSAARILATIATSQDTQNISFSWQNIGGYGFVYTVVLLFPLVIYAYKQKRISLFAFLLFLISAFALAIVTEYTTALLLLMISSIFIFVSEKLSFKGMVWIGIIGIVFVMLFQDTVNDFLLGLASRLNSETLAERLTTLAGGQTALEASEDNRIWLYRYSFDTFLSHPLFGTMFGGSGRIGGHSAILDTLGQYGIIGGAALFCMYRKVYRVFVAPYREHNGYGFIVWTFIQTIFLSAVNTGLWFSVLALFMPLMLFAINKEERQLT